MSDKLTEWLTKPFLDENVDLPVNIGDTVKMGKFKNKKVVVKSIDWNEKGDLLINGRPALKFRLMPKPNVFDNENVNEGVNDPGIFKAVFLAGGPGSGKTYIARQLFGIPDKFNISMSGMKMVNSDKELKHLLNKFGFGTDLDKMPDEVFKDLTASGQSGLRKFSKELTAQRMKLYQKGKLGMIIDGTGHDYGKLNKIKKDLEKDGYETYMVFVNTSLEVAQKRNQERDRILPPKLLEDSWKSVQKNKSKFQSLFGKSNFISVDNNKYLSSEDAEKKFVPLVNKHIKKFMGYPIKSKLAKKWIHKQQLLKKGKVKEITEDKQIKKVVAIYPGRFQPFGPHHKKVYDALKSRFDAVYISTTNIKKPPRHPLNFKEKVAHMVKMGIPKNKIIQEKIPYKADNIGKKHNPKNTAFVFVFGAKDMSRMKKFVYTLKSGKPSYFQDYKKNKGNLEGFIDHGYIVVAPHISVKVGGKEASGTSIRQLLGHPDMDPQEREKLFKQVFGYMDKKIYNMMVSRFSKLFEELSIEITKEELMEFVATIDMKEIIKESSISSAFPIDDGPPTFYPTFYQYRKTAKEWINTMYKGLGWEVLNFILSKHATDPDFDYTLKYSIVPAVAYGREGGGEFGTRFGVKKPIKKYMNRLEKVTSTLGWEIIKWFGIKDDLSGYTGVEVEPPVTFGVDAETQNTDRKELSEILDLSDEVDLLVEGGAAGHMAHPFDDNHLTFGDFKNIIDMSLNGQLNREDNVTEKLDGQNLMISWKDGKLRGARNKGHLKNFGESSPDIAGMKSIFSGRGNIEDAFVGAMKDLQKSIKVLSDKQKEKVFGEGKRWMNLEIIYPASANVIDYDVSELFFHGSIEIDESGRTVGAIKGSAKILEGMIRQINANIQKRFKISKPVVLNLSKVQDYSKKKKYFLSKLKKLQAIYKLKDNDTLGMYHEMYWREYIFNGAKQHKYKITNTILEALVRRWAYLDKSFRLDKKNIKDEKFLSWTSGVDKIDLKKLQYEHMKPFELLFLELGAEILKNLEGFLAVNPKESVQKMKSELKKAILVLKSSKDISKIDLLKKNLEKINAIGGISSIVPTEGLVFKYKGKMYKFTGSYAPVNQLIGALKFSR